MNLRKLIFWMHLIAGVTAGLVILIMSFTGVLLAYEKQIVSWSDRSLLGDSPSGGEIRLPLQILAEKAKEASGGSAPTTFTFYSDHRAISAAAGGSTIYVDSYSGKTIGVGSARIRDFFRSVTNWHRYLALSGDRRETGRSITGVVNAVFLMIVVAGLFLWVPRGSWTRQSLRNVTLFRTGLNSKARNWNWHNVFGFWAAIPLVLIVLSGTIMSYSWANNLVYRLAGSSPPVRGGNGESRGQSRNGAARAAMDLAFLDPLIAIAEHQSSDWKSIRLQIPTSDKGPVSFTIDRGNGGKPQLRSTLVLDRKAGTVVSFEKFEDQDAGRRARSWFRFVHTGEFYGIAGQTIGAIASFAACMLVWTGFSLSFRRAASWNARRKGEAFQARAGRAIRLFNQTIRNRMFWAAAISALLVAGCGESRELPAEQPAATTVPSGWRIYVTNERSGDLSIIDSTINEVISTMPLGKRPRGIHASPDGKTLYVALSGSPIGGPNVDESKLPPPDKSADGIGAFDTVIGRLFKVIPGGSDPEEFSLSKDGTRLFISNEDIAGASIVDIASGRIIKTLKVGEEPEGVTTSPDGKIVYVTNEDSGTITVIDVDTQKVLKNFEVGRRSRSVVFFPNGKKAYASLENDGKIGIIDAVNHKKTGEIVIGTPGQIKPMKVIISADGKTAYTSTGRGKKVFVIDTATDKVTGSFEVGDRPWGIGLSPDNKFLYTANGPSNDVTIVELSTQTVVKRVKVGDGPWGLIVLER